MRGQHMGMREPGASCGKPAHRRMGELLTIVVVWLAAILAASGQPANITNDAVASAEVGFLGNAQMIVPLNADALDKLRYCRASGVPFYLGVRASSPQTTFIWFYGGLTLKLNNSITVQPVLLGITSTCSCHNVTATYNFTTVVTESGDVTTARGNICTDIVAGHQDPSKGLHWGPDDQARTVIQFSLTGLPEITSAAIVVPGSAAQYSTYGGKFRFVVMQADYPTQTDLSWAPQPVWQALSTENGRDCEPAFIDPTAKPTHGDPVDLSSGVETHAPGSDLMAYNGHGPSAAYSRTYSTRLASQGQASPGLPAGWTHGYDYAIARATTGTTWGDLRLCSPGGGADTLSPVLSNGAPTGELRPLRSDVPYRATGVPGSPTGSWQAITLVFADSTTWQFTPQSDGAYRPTRLQDALGREITLQWDGQGRLTGSKDHWERTLLTCVYDGGGWLTTVLDNASRKVCYTLTNGRLAAVSQIVAADALQPAARWRYTYTGGGLLETVRQPSPTGTGESVLTFTYDGQGRVAAQIDAKGNRSVYTYGASSTVVTQQTPAGEPVLSWTQHFDSLGRDTGVTDASGRRSTITYGDSRFPYRATRVEGMDHRTATVAYDSLGRVAQTVDAAGLTTTYTYSETGATVPFGRMSRTVATDAAGQALGTVELAYDFARSPGGLVRSVSAPRPGDRTGAQVTTRFTYDRDTPTGNWWDTNQGRVTGVSGPGTDTTAELQATVAYEYKVDADYDLFGNPGTLTLDFPAGAPLVTTDKHGRKTHYRYDTRGNVTLIIDAEGRRTDLAYNLADQPTELLLPAETPGGARQRMTIEYVCVGGLAFRTRLYAGGTGGALLREVTTTYDAEGQVLGQTGTAEDATSTYDAVGRLATLTDGDGHVTRYSYDDLGRLAQVAYPGGRLECNLAFDDAGRVTLSADGSGRQTRYTYAGPGGALSAVDLDAATAPGDDITYHYDASGQLETVTDSTGTRSFRYDLLGNPLEQTTTYTALGARAYTVGYSYNPNGSVRQMATPAGTFRYRYDADGRPEALTNPAGKVSRWAYRADGLLERQTLGNRAWTTYQYDPLGRLARLRNHGARGQELSEFALTARDPLGNVTAATALVPGVPGMSGTRGLAYDPARDSLTQERWTPDRGVSQVAPYAFDGVGNLLRTPHELPGYTDPTRFTRAYNALNQWVGYRDSQDGENGPVQTTVDNLPGGDPLFAYDGNGNPTRYKGAACTYDAQNHLTAYGTAMTAGYRGDGLRAWKESGGTRTYYLYVGTTLLAEVDAGGTVTAYNTWGPTGLLARTRPGAHEETWYQFDLQGDVAQRLAADGRVLSTDRYDAWGNAQAGSNTADPYGYKAQAGYYRDAESGLYLCTFRYYDPQAGRWVTEDPIGYAGGLNVYAYCGNDPWGSVDPLGLADDEWMFRDNVSMGSGGDGKMRGIHWDQKRWDQAYDEFQDKLGSLGAVPVIGEPVDGINALIYAKRGKYTEAAISGASMIPVLGAMAGTGAKAIKRSTRIVGLPHGGLAHKVKTLIEVGQMVRSGKYQTIYMNRALSTVTEGRVMSRLRPDAAGSRIDGLIDLVEVVSPSQKYYSQQVKVDYMLVLLGPLAGEGKAVNLVDL